MSRADGIDHYLFQFLSVVTFVVIALGVWAGLFQFLSVVTLSYSALHFTVPFQFLSVVTLKPTPKLLNVLIVLVSFSCYILVESNFVFVIEVLVSFSCYINREIFNVSGHGFSFFQLLHSSMPFDEHLWQLVLVSFSCYRFPVYFIEGVLYCFSFFQLLPRLSYSNLQTFAVLVSFSCYFSRISAYSSIFKFQFLSVVTIPILFLLPLSSGFSFFQLLLGKTSGSKPEKMVLVSFSCYVKRTIDVFESKTVLVSFSCYNNRLRKNAWSTSSFSFFQLLLTLPALDLHVSLRVYKSSPTLNALSLPNSFKGVYRNPRGRVVKGKVTH